jgi:hypothetical protein
MAERAKQHIGAIVKLARSREHWRDLAEEVRRIVESNPYLVRVERQERDVFVVRLEHASRG